MTTKFIDVTGKTEDEAVASALARLGLDRDEVSVEILERAKKGFLGIGASPAKVRVTYEVVEEAPAAPVQPAAPRPVEKKPEPAVKAEPVSAPVREEKRPERPERPEKKKPSRPRNDRRDRPQRQPEEQPAAPAGDSQPVPPPGEPCDDEKARQIKTFLTGLLEHMESNAQVKVYLDSEGRYKVILEGEKLGALIGRRGETLDAIQQLTNYSVNKGGEKRVRVHVDAENYRLKREQSLQHLAHKVAGKVLKFKRNVTLEPMNAYERHVIHTALQDVDGVTTYSMGTDPNRRVIVAYDRGNAR
ncbi:MAG: KH domain-containing protein [Oscillibacter sp.]|nr:KH domain-containing protein [Oscillibacter sp.]